MNQPVEPLSAVQRYTLTFDFVENDSYLELDPDGRWCLFDEAEDAARVAAPSDGLREAVVAEMENEGVVTWGDDGHRARFLAEDTRTADPGGLRERIEALPRHTTPDGEETYIEWAALRDLLARPDVHPITGQGYAADEVAVWRKADGQCPCWRCDYSDTGPQIEGAPFGPSTYHCVLRLGHRGQHEFRDVAL